MRSDSGGNAIQIARYVAGQPLTLSLSTTSSNVTLKPDTAYRLWASADCFFRVDASAQPATTSSHPLKAGLDTLLHTDTVNLALSAVTATGTGILYLSELDTQSN